MSSTASVIRAAYVRDDVLPSVEAAGEQAVHTATGLARAGWACTMFAPRSKIVSELGPESLERHYRGAEGFAVVDLGAGRAGASAVRRAAYARRAFRALRDRSFDLVYTRDLGVVLRALLSGYRCVYDHYRPFPEQYPALRPYLRWLMGHPRFLGFIGHSEYVATSYRQIGVAEDRLLVAYNGFHPDVLGPPLDPREARAQVGLPLDRPVVVYAGRINARKGLDAVVGLAQRLPKMLFVLVGAQGGDGSIGPLTDAPNVRVAPWRPVEALAPYLYGADVLLLPPSDAPLRGHGTTVLPIKVFLYLAAGKPILAPSTPDVCELLRDGCNAALVSPGDLDAASSRLASLLADSDCRSRLASGASQMAQSLTWEARGKKIDAFVRCRLAATPAIPFER